MQAKPADPLRWPGLDLARPERERPSQVEVLASAPAQPPPPQVLLAMATVTPGEPELEAAERAVRSAQALLELAAIEGGEQGARIAEEAFRALAAAEAALVGAQAAESRDAPPQAARPVDAPTGVGAGDALGGAALQGNGDLTWLAQQRVDYIAGLVGPSASRRARRGGVAVLQFRVDAHGYVQDVRVLRPSGSAVLDEEAETALHLAEPFPFTERWLDVTISFADPP